MTDASAGPTPPKSSSGLLKFVLLGCLGCGCLFTAFMGAAIGIPMMLLAPPVDAARSHLTLAASDPARAWAECAPVLKAATSEAQFVEFVAGHPEYYKAADITFSERNIVNGQCTLTGSATSATGAVAPLRVELTKEGETWRVQYVGAP